MADIVLEPRFLTPAAVPKPQPFMQRLASIDIYRGMVMFLMLAEVLKLDHLYEKHPDCGWAKWISFHTSHVAWRGCSLHDMIQPSFTFLVGVAMALSLESRAKRGQTKLAMFGHALLRSVILIFLGIFLRSLNKPITNFTFDDTLTQIGLGYWILFLLSTLSIRVLIVALVLILVGYWGAFVTFRAPPIDFPYEQVGVPETWTEHMKGWMSHFNKNSNLAWHVDVWWMNLFPREKPFEYSGGGYATLSFIPTLGTMILGLIAGKLLVAKSQVTYRVLWFGFGAATCLFLGWGLQYLEICPIVKRIWTPAWVLWSGGICFFWLMILHAVCEGLQFKRWGFPFMIIGANSIVAYVMSWTLEKPIEAALHRHFGYWINMANEERQHWIIAISSLVIVWLMLFWLYRQKVFVRI